MPFTNNLIILNQKLKGGIIINVRFGIIGLGNIARKLADSVNLCENAELYAVASRNAQRAKDFSSEYGAKCFYSDYESLIKDKNVDVVYIALPHSLHVSTAIQAIESGKAVLCEKPLATNLADAKKVIITAKQHSTLFMEGMWTNHLPAIKKAKEWIEEGKIGTVSLMNASFGFCAEVDPDSRLFNPDLAGGALYDVGCYGIAAALNFAKGKPSFVAGTAKIGSTNVDEVGAAILGFPSGMIAQIGFSIRAATDQNAYIYGTKGKIILKDFWKCQEAVCLDNTGETIGCFTDSQQNGFVYQVEEMCRLFQNKQCESSAVSWDNTLCCASIFDQLTNQWISH